MNYDLDGICQDCIYLEKIKPLFEEKDKEIERLNNIILKLENKIYYLYAYSGLDTKNLDKELKELQGSDKNE